MLAGLLQAFTAPVVQPVATHSARLASNAQTTGPGLTANDLQSLKQKDPNNKKLDKPKAYLNYVFFDKELNFVDEGSGVKQVDGEAGELETLSSGKVVAKKNGYVYVFTSNESQQDVLPACRSGSAGGFDNFGVMQITGPVLEETHYYPFGMTMAKISTTAPLKLANNYKYNSIELNNQEFSDGSGLDLYTAYYRSLDPQIGRWAQIDPKAVYAVSPYIAMLNNPILLADPLGDTTLPKAYKGAYSTKANNVLDELVIRYHGNYDPLYTGLDLVQSQVHWVSRGKSGRGFKTNNLTYNPLGAYGITPLGGGLAVTSSVLEWLNRLADGVEIGSKYVNKLVRSEGLEIAGKVAKRIGTPAALLSIGVNGYRFYRGDISGSEFGYSSYVTTIALGSSIAFGPEAGVVVEIAGMGIPYLYKGINSALEQASWGITNWENNFQNSVANKIINY